MHRSIQDIRCQVMLYALLLIILLRCKLLEPEMSSIEEGMVLVSVENSARTSDQSSTAGR